MSFDARGIRNFAAALLCLSPLLEPPLAGQPASLVRDINVNRPAKGLPIRHLVAAGGQLFFQTPIAFDGFTDRRLWVSGGSADSTRLVLDLCAGFCLGQLDIAGSFGNLVLFQVHPDVTPHQLWRSDGTGAGTFPLTTSRSLRQPTEFKGALYLAGCNDEAPPHCELWTSDGTQAGTGRIELGAGFDEGSVIALAASGNRIYFTLREGPTSTSLWAKGGEGEAPVRLKGFAGDGPLRLAAAGDRLFFTTGDVPETTLWTSDGSASGTVSLRSFGVVLSRVGDPFLVADGKVYFDASDPIYGHEAWVSDGTPSGTRRISAFPSAGAQVFNFRSAGGHVLFHASDGGDNIQLFTTAGTLESTRPLPIPTVPELSSVDAPLLGPWELGPRAVYFSVDREHGYEPWVTNGTPEGTHLLADLCPGRCSSVDPFTQRIANTGREIVFVASEPGIGEQIWRTDGTAAGTLRLTEVSGVGPRLDGGAARLGSQLFFGVAEAAGPALWRFEGTAPAQRDIVVAPDGPGSDPHDLTPFQGGLLFAAWNGNEDFLSGLWRTDGTAAGTVRLGGVNVDRYGTSLLTVAGGFAYFVSDRFQGNGQLMRTDGTPGGTIALRSPLHGDIAAFNGKLLFGSYQGGDAAGSIWTSDGTRAGTVKLFEMPEPIPTVTHIEPIGSEIYLSTGGSFAPLTIWRSDGTTAGTRKLATEPSIQTDEFDPGFVKLGAKVLFTAGTAYATDGSDAGTVRLFPTGVPQGRNAVDLRVLGDAAYFIATTPEGGTGLWRTDGTPDGTRLLKSVTVLIQSFPYRPHLIAGGGRLWLFGSDPEHGEELWISDGTESGTAPLRDLNPGPGGSSPSAPSVVGDRLYFTASDGAHGLELWTSDGTADGTRMVQDIAPLALSSTPSAVVRAGSRLYFAANGGPLGNELWSLAAAAADGCQASDLALCLGGRYRVEARWRTPGGQAGAGHAVPLTADTGTFWFFDATNIETIVKVLDGTGVNGHVWVFYGALSNVEYNLTVTDTQSGLVRQYFNPAGRLASVGDTRAFGPLGTHASGAVHSPQAGPPSPSTAGTAGRTKAGVCQATAQRLCLGDGRFAVEVAWKDFQGHIGMGATHPLSGDTGAFWFFDASNIELVVKALDARAVNGHFWIFFGALSNVEYTLTVTDTETGAVRTYKNPSGRFASVADTLAF